MTKENLEARLENVNRRMESRGSIIRYKLQGRNGYTGLDAYPGCRLVTAGTKREVGTFLHAMIVALDDADYIG
jgi:hypothetical protein